MKNSTHILIIFLIILMTAACTWLKPIDQPKEEPPAPLAGTTQFDYWIHGPLHPSNGQAVTFESIIKEPVGLQKAELYIYEYELYKTETGLPSKRKRENGQWGKVQSWTGNGKTKMTLSYTWSKGFPKASQIEYVFKAIDTEGKETERLALFDAGTSPWPTDKILLYSATREPLTQTFNLCFFPDVDFKRDWADFLGESREMIFDGFHQSNVMVQKKERWAFFYTQQEADGLNIALDFTNPDHYPPFMKGDIIMGIDAFGLLHKTPYSDGSYLYGNIHFLSQNVFTSESYNIGTAIHEMGHAVFQLSDEYNGCACFEPMEGFSNVYSNIVDCQTFLNANEKPDSHCHEFYGYDGRRWFTPEDYVYFPTLEACMSYNKINGHTENNCITFIDVDESRSYRAEQGVCIMTDDGDDKLYPFQDACMTVINDYYSRFGGELLASNREAQELEENMYGYEPVVYLELEEQQGKWTADVQKIDYGIREKTNRNGNSAKLFLMEKNKKVAFQMLIDMPGEGHFCGGTFSGQSKTSDFAKCMVTIPYSSDLSEIIVDTSRSRNKDLAMKGDDRQMINLETQLKKAAVRFERRKKR